MFNPEIFAIAFARAVSLLRASPPRRDQQKAALRAVYALTSLASATLRLYDGVLSVDGDAVPGHGPLVDELKAQLQGHGVTEVAMARGASAAELLTLLRSLAVEVGDYAEGDGVARRLAEARASSIAVLAARSDAASPVSRPPSVTLAFELADIDAALGTVGAVTAPPVGNVEDQLPADDQPAPEPVPTEQPVSEWEPAPEEESDAVGEPDATAESAYAVESFGGAAEPDPLREFAAELARLRGLAADTGNYTRRGASRRAEAGAAGASETVPSAAALPGGHAADDLALPDRGAEEHEGAGATAPPVSETWEAVPEELPGLVEEPVPAEQLGAEVEPVLTEEPTAAAQLDAVAGLVATEEPAPAEQLETIAEAVPAEEPAPAERLDAVAEPLFPEEPIAVEGPRGVAEALPVVEAGGLAEVLPVERPAGEAVSDGAPMRPEDLQAIATELAQAIGGAKAIEATAPAAPPPRVAGPQPPAPAPSAPASPPASLEDALAAVTRDPYGEGVRPLLSGLPTLVAEEFHAGRTRPAMEAIATVVGLEAGAPDGKVKESYASAVRALLTRDALSRVAALVADPGLAPMATTVLLRGGAEAADVLGGVVERGETSDARRSALAALLRLPQGASSLARMLASGEGARVRNVALLAGELRVESAVPALGKLLGHHEEDVRRAAVVALAHVGTPTAVDLLRRALSEGSLATRMLVAGGVGGPHARALAMPILALAESETDAAVQGEYYRALGRIGSPEVLTALIAAAQPGGRLFHRRRAAPRIAAVEGLKAAGGPVALRALDALRSDANPEVRDAVARALSVLIGQAGVRET